jgi:dihydroorotase
MRSAPARIVRLDTRGTLRDGAPAHITIIDPSLEWTIDAEQFASKSRNCPVQGWQVRGRATHTIVGGETKWMLQ